MEYSENVSKEDEIQMKIALGQWKILVDKYQDISTKKNEKEFVLFDKPFFETDEDGKFMKNAKGNINIKAKCLGCKKILTATSNNLSRHRSCEDSKVYYLEYVATRKVLDESNSLQEGDLPKSFIEKEEIDMRKENIMMKEELTRMNKEAEEFKNQSKKREDELKKRIDSLEETIHDFISNAKYGSSYNLYHVPNKRPGLVKIYRMIFGKERDRATMAATEQSARLVSSAMKEYDFDVESTVLCTSTADLFSKVKDLTARDDLAMYRSIFVFILSHGSYDCVSDEGNNVLEIQRIKNELISCDSLFEKPKILVTEACQIFQNRLPICSDNLKPSRSSVDILDVRSASPGETASCFRVDNIEGQGCAFLDVFANVLTKKTKAILSMTEILFQVQRILDHFYTSNPSLNRFQAPVFSSSLRCELFLSKKKVS